MASSEAFLQAISGPGEAPNGVCAFPPKTDKVVTVSPLRPHFVTVSPHVPIATPLRPARWRRPQRVIPRRMR